MKNIQECRFCNVERPIKEFGPYNLEDIPVVPDTDQKCSEFVDRLRTSFKRRDITSETAQTMCQDFILRRQEAK